MRLNFLLLVLLLVPVVSATSISFDRDVDGILSEDDLDYWIAGVEFDLFSEQGLLYLIDSLPVDGEFVCKTENCLDIPLYTNNDNIAQQRTIFILQGLGAGEEEVEDKVSIPEPSAFFLNLFSAKITGKVTDSGEPEDLEECLNGYGSISAEDCYNLFPVDQNEEGTGTTAGTTGSQESQQQNNQPNAINNLISGISGIFGNQNNQGSGSGEKQTNSLNNRGPTISPGIWNPPQSNNPIPINTYPGQITPGVIIPGPTGPSAISAQVIPGQSAPNGYILSIGTITGNAVNSINSQAPAASSSNSVSVPSNSCYSPLSIRAPRGCPVNTANGCPATYGWDYSCEVREVYSNPNSLPSCSSGQFPCNPSLSSVGTTCPQLSCSAPPTLQGRSCRPVEQKSANGCQLCPTWDCSSITNPVPCPQVACSQPPQIPGKVCRPVYASQQVGSCPTCPTWDCQDVTPKCNNVVCPNLRPGCSVISPGGVDANGCQVCANYICTLPNTQNPTTNPTTTNSTTNPSTGNSGNNQLPNCAVPAGCNLKDPLTCQIDCPAVSPIAVCQKDIKRCDDGSYVTRDPMLACQFPQCPTTQTAQIICLPNVKQCADGSYILTGTDNSGNNCALNNVARQKACPVSPGMRYTEYGGVCTDSSGRFVNCGTSRPLNVINFNGKCIEMTTGKTINSRLCTSPILIKG